MSTIQPFFIRAGGLSADLLEAKCEWSKRLLLVTSLSPRGVRPFTAAVSPAPEQNVVGVGVDEKMVVHKFGRTTSHTAGRVSSVTFDVNIPYDMGVLTFEDQIAIRGLNGSRFSDQGDSGSAIVVRTTGQVIGLLFGGRQDGTLAFANHITDVFDALGVTLA